MTKPFRPSQEPDRDLHLAPGVEHDLRLQLDTQLARCPVLKHPDGSITLLSHSEVRAAALDPETFSSAVSAYRALPNSLDGEEHRQYRKLIDTYFTDEKVSAQEPQCLAHAKAIIAALPRGVTVSALHDIGTPFAVRAQRTWLGWPESVEDELVQWVADNQDASRRGNRNELREIAERFDRIISRLLDARKHEDHDDVTTQLMNARVNGKPLEHTEIVSILRNWTSGDLGSLASSVGVIVHHLASDIALQSYFRSLIRENDTHRFEDAIEEILRIDDPFVSNRRITTHETEVAGVTLAENTRVVLNWTSANRDPAVFSDPDAFNPEANREQNLVFGIGPHICPGRTLTLMELRVVIWELLNQTDRVAFSPEKEPIREHAPVSGWARVPIVLSVT